MKRVRWFVVVAAIVFSGIWIFSGPQVNIIIAQRQSTADVARNLKQSGVLRFPKMFRALAKLAGFDRTIRPGTYHLRTHMSGPLALWSLMHSQPEMVRILIPEGFSARQIAERLEANGVSSANEFMAYVNQNHLEGYLFPATYLFMPNTPAEAVAHRMHQEFKNNVDPEISKRPPTRLTEKQVIILASIVQREAILPQERPMIAAVCLNRLARRMRLEMDPTVQYALGGWKKGLTLQDLKVNSPYNTYVHFGLPPTPICSPGIDAVKAVLEPAKTDALYFVADNTGGHTFNVSYEEHLKAKFKAKRERRLKRS